MLCARMIGDDLIEIKLLKKSLSWLSECAEKDREVRPRVDLFGSFVLLPFEEKRL